jgi:hypothetical protein
MKKNTLKESDINRIVKKVIRESYSETNEGLGDTWTGVKGFFKGKGYYYTKNLSKLNNIIEELAYTEKFLNKIKKKCENIVDESVNSGMKDTKSDHILDLVNRIIDIIEYHNLEVSDISQEIKQII